jgi:hypothetical protein
MGPIFQRLLRAYQPLQQRGLLLDGRQLTAAVPPTAAARRRTLVALAGLCHPFFRSRIRP